MSEIIKAENTGNIMNGFYSSLKGDTQEDRLAIFAAVSNSEALDDHVGETLFVTDVVIQAVEVKGDDEEGRTATRIILVDQDGKAFGCTSTGVETSVRNLIGIVGEPTWHPAIPLRVAKKQGRHGYKFTTLDYVATV